MRFFSFSSFTSKEYNYTHTFLDGFFFIKILFLVGLVLVLTSGGSFVFASCASCNKTPTGLNDYLEVMDKLLQEVEKIPSVEKTEIKQAITSLTQAQEALSNSLRNEIITVRDQYDNSLEVLNLLGNSKSLKRDLDKLYAIDGRITKALLDLAQKGQAREKIDSKVLDLDKIDQLLQKLEYVSLGSTGTGADKIFNMDNKSNYADFLKLLKQMNVLYRQFHYTGYYSNQLADIGSGVDASAGVPGDEQVLKIDDEKLNIVLSQLEKLVDKTFVVAFNDIVNEYSSNTEIVTIKLDVLTKKVWSIYGEYACSTGRKNECDDGTKKIRDKSLKLYKERIVNDGSDAIDTIKDATIRLKGALGGGDDEAKEKAEERKQGLLKSKWGRNTPNGSLFDGSTVRGSAKAIGGVFKEIGQGFWDTTEPARTLVKNVSKLDCSGFIKYGNCVEKDSPAAVQRKKDKKSDSAAVNQDVYGSDNAKSAKIDEIFVEYDNRPDSVLDDMNDNQYAQAFTQKLLERQGYLGDRLEGAKKDIFFSQTKYMTKKTVELSVKVHKAANTYGDYDSDGTINHSLAHMCEEQCTNLGDKKCREDHE